MFKTLDEMPPMERSTREMAWKALIRWAGGLVIAMLQFEAIYTALLELDSHDEFAKRARATLRSRSATASAPERGSLNPWRLHRHMKRGF